MFSRKNAYEASDQGKGLDEMSRKLAVDLRKHVRRLEMLPHHTKEWLGLTDSLQHISNVALMEHRLPQDSEDSTLWEGEELTVRFMLEEGKLNLCLRLMEEYKRAQAAEQAKGTAAYSDFLSRVAACEAQEAEPLKARLLLFEQSLGMLLRCALDRVEAVQTTDLPLLVTHCAAVLAHCSKVPPTELYGWEWDRSQEAAVLRYLACVMVRVERLGEEKIMPLLKQGELLPLVVAHLHTHSVPLKDECGAGAYFLALAMDTEDFATYKSTFLPAVSKAQLKDFKPLFLAALTADAEGRRKFRPLLDEVAKAGG